jgi:energy-coupling factor transport system permease protein
VERAGARAWGIWLISALAVVFIIDHPAIDLLVTLAAAVIAVTFGARSSFAGFIALGAVLVVIRTALFALTGHTGETVLLQLPALHLPQLLGGGTFGGAVTAEVVAYTFVEGLRILSVLALFGAFLAVTETMEILRLVPRFLFEAGLIVNIAMAFAPQLSRSLQQIREAQLMRGEPKRRIAPVVVPLLATALERSAALAESMDSRGYGRSGGPAQTEARWRAAVTGSLLVLVAAASLWAMRTSAVAAVIAIAALATLTYSLTRLSQLVPRTSYRHKRWSRRDRMLSALAIAVAVAALALSGSGLVAEGFSPYRDLGLSAPHPLAIILSTCLALPALWRTDPPVPPSPDPLAASPRVRQTHA